MPHEHEYHPLTVRAVVDETPDTRSFVLDVPPALHDLFAYRAGQFCTFRATIDGDNVVRCYSMSSSPERDEPLTTTVKRVPGGRMSNWMNDTLVSGDTIDVLRPAGLFVLNDERTTPIVAFAGGSGITPIISIVKTALVATDREITLVYANRDRHSVIFGDELERLAATSGGRLTLHRHLAEERGCLDAAACAAFAGERAHADFYICGPAPYMDVVEAGLASLGAAPDHVFIERVVTPEPVTPGVATETTEALTITLAGTTHTLSYTAGDTILEAARRGGLNPPFSCEMGNCATCMAHLDAGAATMRANNALTNEEVDTGWVLTCQAVPTAREVVVDYDA
jgi:ferredoxin-NADP reductase